MGAFIGPFEQRMKSPMRFWMGSPILQIPNIIIGSPMRFLMGSFLPSWIKGHTISSRTIKERKHKGEKNTPAILSLCLSPYWLLCHAMPGSPKDRPLEEKGFLDRWGCGPYRAIQGAFRTAHWAFMRPSVHSSWAIFACTTVRQGTRANVHTHVAGSWEGEMILPEKHLVLVKATISAPHEITPVTVQ